MSHFLLDMHAVSEQHVYVTSHRAQADAPPLPEPSQEALQQLVAMGFEEQRAAHALQVAHNDVQTALSHLL